MNIEQEIQNILDKNFTRGNNAKALQELLVLYNVVRRNEQLKSIAPNECEKCGVLIDYRLNECRDCRL